MRYDVEVRYVWGKTIYAVIDGNKNNRTVARCNTQDDARDVRDGLNVVMPAGVKNA